MTAVDELTVPGPLEPEETDAELLGRVHKRTANRLSTVGAGLDAVAREALASDLAHEVIDGINQERMAVGRPKIQGDRRDELVAAVLALIEGAGALEAYLADDTIENLDANGPFDVFVTKAGGRPRKDRPLAISREAWNAYLKSLVMRGGDLGEHRLDRLSPVAKMSIGRHRVTLVLGGPGTDGVGAETYLSARRHRTEIKRLMLEDFVALGTLTRQAADFLAAAVRAGLNVVIAGPADAGKTTLQRALIHELPGDERKVTIESVPELDLRSFPDLHPNVVELYTRSANAEGVGRVGVGDLLHVALSLNPKRIFVGEVLPGEDVVSWFNVLSSGHDGTVSTLHARSSQKVFTRLVAYTAQSPGNALDPRSAVPLIAAAVDVVVYISKLGDRRLVTSILLVGHEADGRILSDEVFGLVDGELVAAAGISQAEVAKALRHQGYLHRVAP